MLNFSSNPVSRIGTLTPSMFSAETVNVLPPSVQGAQSFVLKTTSQSRVRAWFTDMDGTLFYAKAPPSPEAIVILHHLVGSLDMAGIPCVYISGRRLPKIEAAIEEFHLPIPPIVAASVGAEIFTRKGDAWTPDQEYTDFLKSRWCADPEATFDSIMNRSAKGFWVHTSSTECKRSYAITPQIPIETLRTRVTTHLLEDGLDNIAPVVSGPNFWGDLNVDFLPDNGSKSGAGRFIAQKFLGLDDLSSVLFTGDSGNDLDMLLASGFAALVRNEEAGLVQHLRDKRSDMFFSPYPDIYGVIHSMFYFNIITADAR